MSKEGLNTFKLGHKKIKGSFDKLNLKALFVLIIGEFMRKMILIISNK